MQLVGFPLHFRFSHTRKNYASLNDNALLASSQHNLYDMHLLLCVQC